MLVQSSLASKPSQSPPPDVGGSSHGRSHAEAARAASPAGARVASHADLAKSTDARAASPAGARAASPAQPSRMGSRLCNPGDVLMGPPPRVHPLPGHRLQSGLSSHQGLGAADRSSNGVVPRAGAPRRSRDSAGLTLPPPEDVAATVRYAHMHGNPPPPSRFPFLIPDTWPWDASSFLPRKGIACPYIPSSQKA